MKIDLDTYGGDAYMAVGDKLIELGCDIGKQYVVDLWTSNLGFDRVVLTPCYNSWEFDYDWYEGGDVELLGFASLDSIDVPKLAEDNRDDLIKRQDVLSFLSEMRTNRPIDSDRF